MTDLFDPDRMKSDRERREQQALARALHDLRLRVRTVERSNQMSRGSIIDKPLDVYDPDENLTITIGEQYDGTHAPVPLTGPEPPIPTPPVLVPGLRSVRVHWDGLWEPLFDDDGNIIDDQVVAPMDFARIEVHASTDPEFEAEFAATIVGTFETPRGGDMLVPLATTGEDYTVKFVARTLSGKRSDASDGATVAAEEVEQSDGFPPDHSPTAVAIGQIGQVYLAWDAVENVDPVVYRVYAGATADFPVVASYLVAEVSATYYVATVQRYNPFARIPYDSDTFFRIVALDADGEASPGPVVSARAQRAASNDLGDNIVTLAKLGTDASNAIANAASSASAAMDAADDALTAAQQAQATADGSIRTYYASTPPWGNGSAQPDSVLGDMWFDLDDGQAYRWNGTSWQIIEDSSIAAALAAAQNAQTTADGKITAYYQTTAPIGGEVGDLWYDTDNGNKAYYCSSSSPVTWTAIPAGLAALGPDVSARALGAIFTYYQNDAPSLATTREGDLWVDTNDGNRLYRRSSTAWVVSDDQRLQQALTAAANAQSTADGKIRLYAQNEAPTGLTATDVGDLWVDTNDGNRLWRWDGAAWVDARDTTIAAANANALAAQNAADEALVAAQDAEAKADGKVATFFQGTAPTGLTATDVGDLWFDTDDGNKMYRWTGSAWEERQDDAIAQAAADAEQARLAAVEAQADADSAAAQAASANAAAAAAQGTADQALADAGDAQATADGKVATYFQTAPPWPDNDPNHGADVGDLWFDTDDSAKLYRWSGTVWALSSDQRIATALSNAANAQTTANSRITTFYQTSIPTALAVGDLWVDTDDSNHLYRAASIGANEVKAGEWVSVRDATIAAASSSASAALTAAQGAQTAAEQAQATADGAITTHYVATAPWANGSTQPAGRVGDLWFDTDDKRTYRWDGTNWVEIRDPGITTALTNAQNAQTTADGKITAYYQNTAPWAAGSTTHDLDVGDLWFDLDDKNRPYFWASNRTWTEVRDLRVDDAAAAAAAASSTASAAQADADQALTAAADAQATADGKVRTFFQTAAPTGLVAADVGDLWFDTDDGNKMYRWSGSAWVVSQDTAITTAINNAAAANTAAGNAQTTANSRITTFYQTAPPTSLAIGDLWVDTDDGNRLYRAASVGATAIAAGGWVDVRDTTIAAASAAASAAQTQATNAMTAAEAAQATADGAIRTYYQSAAPWTTNSDPDVVGDMWFDQDDGQAYRWTGTAWQVIEDSSIAAALQAAQNAQTTADGKITAFYATTPPWANGAAGHANDVGDLWYDTDDQNKPYYWSGSAWTLIRDTGIDAAAAAAASAQAAASAAQSTATAAQADADQALADAADAQATADGKTQTYFQTAAPTGLVAADVGDLWFDTDDGYKMYRWDGAAWVLSADTRISQAMSDAAAAQQAASNALAADEFSTNPFFDNWPSGQTYPTGYEAGAGAAPTRETAILRTLPTASRFNVAAATQSYMTGRVAFASMPNIEYVTVTLDFYLVSGDLGGAGLIARWRNTVPTNFDTSLNLAAEVASPTVGKWYRVSKTLRRPTGFTGTFNNFEVLAGTITSLGTITAKNLIIDRISVVPASASDVLAFNAATAASVTTLTSTVNSKTTTFYQPGIPTSVAVGDLWIDTDDGNRLYRAAAVGATTIAAGGWVDVRDASIAAAATSASNAMTAAQNAQTAAQNAQATADGATVTFYQAAAPTSGMTVGDLWFDTDDNKAYRYSGSAWVSIQDTNIVAALSAAQNAQTTADGKITAYYQTGAPWANNATGHANDVGDLWYDTDDQNRPYYWNGTTWVDVRDRTIADAAAAAAAAQTAANTAAATASSAQADADAALADAADAQATADGKTRTFFQTTAPTGMTATDVGDLWFDTDDGYKMYRWDGDSWEVSADTRISQAMADAAAANTAASAAVQTANAAARTYFQTAAPTGLVAADAGDLWFDTDDGNKMYRWSGSAWVLNQDQALADSVRAYVQSRGVNLVTNGTGMLGDNTNFSTATYVGNDAPTGAKASFLWPAGAASRYLDELIPVDPSKVYAIDFDYRQTAGQGRFYQFFAPYDSYGNAISPTDYMEQANTRTTLAAPLNPGDTTVTLTSAANWNNAAGTSTHLRTIIFWDYVDAGGKVWAPGTYSRNWVRDAYADGGIAGNVITLRTPWAGPAKAAGTVVGNGSSGGSFMYVAASNVLASSTWTHYTGRTQKGVHTAIASSAQFQFPAATAQVKLGYLVNYAYTGSTVDPASRQAVANVTLTEVTVAADAAALAATKITTFYQTSVPVSTAVGDLWVDTDDGNRLYRAASVGADAITAGEWVDVRDATIATAAASASSALTTANNAQTAASNAQATADGAIRTYYQSAAPWANGSSQPAAALGDLWFDTDDQTTWRWDGTNWVQILDPRITNALAAAQNAQTTADGKISAYYSPSAPWANGATGHTNDVGDIWYDTDDGNKPYYWASNSTWTVVQDAAITTAQNTANARTTTFYQTTPPTSLAVGDLWIDTDDNNRLYRSAVKGSATVGAGGWVDVRDAGIAAAASAAASAQTAANNAATAASTAQATADGAIRTYYQSAAPTGLNSTTDVGDMWFDVDDGQAYRWNGTAWQTIEDNSIAAALAAAQNAQTTADGKITSYFGTRPWADGAAGHANDVGDLWYETAAGNKVWYWNGTAWVAVPTGLSGLASDVTARNLGAITTFTGTTDPATVPANAVKEGDMWHHGPQTLNGVANKYVLKRRTSSAWVEVSDAKIESAIASATSAANLADAKMRIFYEAKHASGLYPASNPTMVATDVGDLWFRTDEGNKPYRWTGSIWSAFVLGATAIKTSDGLVPATSPTPTAIGGVGAIFLRWTAVSNADPVTYRVYGSKTSGFTPDVSNFLGEVDGTSMTVKRLNGVETDTYDPNFDYEHDAYFKIIAADADGPSTVIGAQVAARPFQVTGPDIAATTVRGEHMVGGTFTGDLFSGEVVLASRISTGAIDSTEGSATYGKVVGQRVDMSPNGLELIDPTGEAIVSIPTNPSASAYFKGRLETQELRVMGGTSIESTTNEIAKGASLTLSAGITAPISQPSMSYDYERIKLDTTTAHVGADRSYGDLGSFALNPAQIEWMGWHPGWNSWMIAQRRTGGFRIWHINPDGTVQKDFSGNFRINDREGWQDVRGLWGRAGELGFGVYYRYAGTWYVQDTAPNGSGQINKAPTPAGTTSQRPAAYWDSVAGSIAVAENHNSSAEDYVRVKFCSMVNTYAATMTVTNSNTSAAGMAIGTEFGGFSRVSSGVAGMTKTVYVWNYFNSSTIQTGVSSIVGGAGWETAERFYTSGAALGFDFDGAHWWSVASDGYLTKYTNWKWTDSLDYLHAGVTWYDSDTLGTPTPPATNGIHETSLSPIATLLMRKRARLRITLPIVPDKGGLDDPDKWRLYMLRSGSAKPAATSMVYQTEGGSATATTVLTMESIGTADTKRPPATSNFPGANPGWIESAGRHPLDPNRTMLRMDGNGRGRFDEVAPPGAVQMYAGNTILTQFGLTHPEITPGWLLCRGDVVSRAAYPALFAVIGTTFNTGSEATTDFRLPDFRDRFPSGTGTTRTHGSSGGADTLPDHTHGRGTLDIGSTDLNRLTNTTTGGTAARLAPTGTNHSHALTGETGIVLGANPSTVPKHLTLNYIIRY